MPRVMEWDFESLYGLFQWNFKSLLRTLSEPVRGTVVFFYDTMCFFIILLCLFYFLEEAIVIVCKINWVKVHDCRDESSVS